MKKGMRRGMASGLVALIALCLLSSCKQEKKESLMALPAPQWQKFVMVNEEDGVPLFKEADERSPRLLCWTEDLESDMIDVQFKWDDEPKPADNYIPREEDLYLGTILPVIGEEGDFYKVSIRNEWRHADEAYVPKAAVTDMETAPITPEVLEGQAYAKIFAVGEGDLKGLCLISFLGDMDAVALEVGELNDNYVAVAAPVSIYANFWEEQQGVELLSSGEFYELKYGPQQALNIEAPEYGGMRLFDATKLSEEQVAEVYQIAKSVQPELVKYYYYFPTYHMFDSTGQLQAFYQTVKK